MFLLVEYQQYRVISRRTRFAAPPDRHARLAEHAACENRSMQLPCKAILPSYRHRWSLRSICNSEQVLQCPRSSMIGATDHSMLSQAGADG